MKKEIREGLKQVRRRRWFMGGLILIYVPAVWVSLELSHSDKVTGIVFGVWMLLLFVAAARAALVPCPRCGNPFHMNGITPLYLRSCLHCGLHINADSTRAKKND